MEKVCKCCQRDFTPYHTVPDQEYCSQSACQRERRNRWRRKKLADDKDYKGNQYDAQKRWRQKNMDYWQRYRDSHPDYVSRNRQKQKYRNNRRKLKTEASTTSTLIAKSDELTHRNKITSGYYSLVPTRCDVIAKSDELIVKIDVITGNYATAP